MHTRYSGRARRAAGVSAVALALLAVGACDNPQDVLLEQQQPQVILPGDVQNPTAGVGLYTGALGRFRSALNGGNKNQATIWKFAALLTDQFKFGDIFSLRNDGDQHAIQRTDGAL